MKERGSWSRAGVPARELPACRRKRREDGESPTNLPRPLLAALARSPSSLPRCGGGARSPPISLAAAPAAARPVRARSAADCSLTLTARAPASALTHDSRCAQPACPCPCRCCRLGRWLAAAASPDSHECALSLSCSVCVIDIVEELSSRLN